MDWDIERYEAVINNAALPSSWGSRASMESAHRLRAEWLEWLRASSFFALSRSSTKSVFTSLPSRACSAQTPDVIEARERRRAGIRQTRAYTILHKRRFEPLDDRIDQLYRKLAELYVAQGTQERPSAPDTAIDCEIIVTFAELRRLQEIEASEFDRRIQESLPLSLDEGRTLLAKVRTLLGKADSDSAP